MHAAQGLAFTLRVPAALPRFAARPFWHFQQDELTSVLSATHC